MNILLKTPIELNKDLATRLRTIRKKQKLSQQQLSEKSDVSLGSIKRFENTGNISLLSLSKIAIALGVSKEMEGLFINNEIRSIKDIIDGQ